MPLFKRKSDSEQATQAPAQPAPSGLPEEVVAACAATATIPLAGPAESLNVAMAGTIALYDWRRSHG